MLVYSISGFMPITGKVLSLIILFNKMERLPNAGTIKT